MKQDEENRGEINDLVDEVQKNEEELEDGIHLALITRRVVKTQLRRMMLMIKETTCSTRGVSSRGLLVVLSLIVEVAPML